eukprot:gene3610-4120_t
MLSVRLLESSGLTASLQKSVSLSRFAQRCFYHRKFQVLDGKVDLKSSILTAQFKENMALEAELTSKIKQASLGGGQKAIERHTKLNNKMLVRDRLARLLDDDYPFLELSQLAGHQLEYGDVPGAGSVTGIGSISGQLCVISANDATVKGGTIYPIGVRKQVRAQEIGQENNLPCVYIVDSGGGFLPLQSELFLPGGRVFYNEAVMSAAGIPQVCVVAGSCTAGAAYIPTMADETVMIDKIGTMFLGGPPLVQAATGEIVTPEELGGAKLHCDVSGCTDYFAVSEEESIEVCKDIMSSLNMKKCLDNVRFYEEPRFCTEELRALAVPSSDKSEMSVYKIFARIFDGSRFREFKPSFGKELVTGFAYLHGILTGVVANNGPLTVNACLKGSHFVELCCQRSIPIIFMHNTQESAQTASEEAAILIKEKAKMMSVVANAKVPKLSVVIGNSFGMDNAVMCGRGMQPRFLYMWPAAKIAMDSPDNLYAELKSPNADKDVDDKIKTRIEVQSTSYYSTARLWDDGIILPQNSRHVLASSLKACLTHREPSFSPKNVIRM